MYNNNLSIVSRKKLKLLIGGLLFLCACVYVKNLALHRADKLGKNIITIEHALPPLAAGLNQDPVSSDFPG